MSTASPPKANRSSALSKTQYRVESGALRLTFLSSSDQIAGFVVEQVTAGKGAVMSTTTPLSHLIYQDNAGNRHETDLSAYQVTRQGGGLRLTGDFTDADGIVWHLAVTVTPDAGQIAFDYHLSVDQPRSYLRWIGPALYAGQGSFGVKKDEALFPGLEYLLSDEPSSDTRFAAPKFANRVTPDAYRITIPLMAVSSGGRSIGLLWDANQDWGSAWRHPGALFSSPNKVQRSARNHAMALFCPSVNPRWFTEGALEAYKTVGVSPNNPLRLTARIAVSSEDGVISIVREWIKAYGVPSVPPANNDYAANVELCVKSYLDVAWDEPAQGWHHTLADPWGPRYELRLINQLWRYGRWSKGDPLLQARARDQVRRALRDTTRLPQIELALTYGRVEEALDAAAKASREALGQQQPAGFWGWTPAAIADIADFKTEDRIKTMGAEQDSASGFTGMKAQPVLTYALVSGDPQAVDSVIRAADWCNTQRRPEGAQTWELHLHVPDVLAAPNVINLNVAAHQFTGDPKYLAMANYWAWTGLPFTYLWNGYYRPIMRYGTIPVFGVTFHDVQSWFGVIVQWNGLVYADALTRLANYAGRTDADVDWSVVAEGMTLHGIQQQFLSGTYLGMYPDAYSAVKGDEDYIWWLNPNLIGLNTFPLAGLTVNAETTVLRGANGQRTHITGGGKVVNVAEREGWLRALIEDQPGAVTYATIAVGGKPQSIALEGEAIAEASDLDAVTQGWRWLESHRAALVKWTSHTSVTELEVQQ